MIIAAKVGIKSYRFTKECTYFICACMDVTTQLELCLHKQTQMLANAACRVGNQQFLKQLATRFLTFYCDPYFLYLFLVQVAFI